MIKNKMHSILYFAAEVGSLFFLGFWIYFV